MPLAVRSRTPEDAELARKLEELAALQTQLAELELQLCNLRLELTEFENAYCAKVGPFYAELDEIEALIAERIAQKRPNDANAAKAAHAARTQAEESRTAAAAARSTPIKAARSESIRELYKTAAKRLHPDLARDDADRRIRDRLMADVNLAYERGDEAKLREVLEEYDCSPDTVVGSDVAAELVRAIRRISLAKKRIQQIQADIAELRDSELFKLMSLVAEQEKVGNDVLSDMMQRLKAQIDAKRDHLRGL